MQIYDVTPEVWQTIQKYAAQYNVDPWLLAAIGQHETAWGRLGLGQKGLYMGYGAFDAGASFLWAGLDRQIRQAAAKMSQWGMTPEATTLDRLQQGNIGAFPTGIYATDQAWPEKVWAWRERIMGQAEDVVMETPEQHWFTAWLDRIGIADDVLYDKPAGVVDGLPWWQRALIVGFGGVLLLGLIFKLMDINPIKYISPLKI